MGSLLTETAIRLVNTCQIFLPIEETKSLIFFMKYSCSTCPLFIPIFDIFVLLLRDIYLDGNHLECEGVIEMIKLLADKAEMEAIERAEKKEEIANGEPVTSSALSQMASASVLNGETQPSDVSKSSRYQKLTTR